jgi:O-antigen/teichoic acid export membrane protein
MKIRAFFQSKENKLLIFLAGIAVMGYFSKYAFNLVLTHYLTPQVFGDFNIAVRLLTIFSTVSLLGTSTASKRFVSNYLQLEHHDVLAGYIQWNTSLIRAPFIICLIVAIASLTIMHLFHFWHLKDIRDYHLAFYILWIVPLAALLSLLNSYLLCANNPLFYALIGNSLNIVALIFFLIVIGIVGHENIASLHLLLVMTLSIVTMLCISLYLITTRASHIYGLLKRALSTRNKPQIDPEWLSVATRLTINGLFMSFIFSIDLMILRVISPYPAHVGYYAVALTVASATLVIPQNIYTFIKPQISSLFRAPDGKEKLEVLLKGPNRLNCITSFIIGIFIIYFAKPLLHHFGVSYTQIAPSLIMLVLGFMISAYAQPAKNILTYTGFESLLLKISMIELSSIFILGSILTFYFDVFGTACATTISCILKTGLFHFISYKYAHVKAYRL